MGLKLYMAEISPPVRSVLLTAEAIGVHLEHIPINLALHEHLKSEYLEINPQHTVPTLDDNGKILWDSHAINIYLVEKYAKDKSLYPDDAYVRGLIHQRLHFDSGVLFPTMVQILRPIVREGAKTIPDDKKEAILEAYALLEKFLEGHEWMVGNNVTLADLNLLPDVTSISAVVPIDGKAFPNITGWLERARGLPYYHINETAQEKFKMFVLSKLN